MLFTILAHRFPAIDIAAILHALLLCLALVVIPIVAVVAVNILWPLIAATLGKLAVGGALTAVFGWVTL